MPLHSPNTLKRYYHPECGACRVKDLILLYTRLLLDVKTGKAEAVLTTFVGDPRMVIPATPIAPIWAAAHNI